MTKRLSRFVSLSLILPILMYIWLLLGYEGTGVEIEQEPKEVQHQGGVLCGSWFTSKQQGSSLYMEI
jgi:hypothetical protein